VGWSAVGLEGGVGGGIGWCGLRQSHRHFCAVRSNPPVFGGWPQGVPAVYEGPAPPFVSHAVGAVGCAGIALGEVGAVGGGAVGAQSGGATHWCSITGGPSMDTTSKFVFR
jgi:hypothetical protein